MVETDRGSDDMKETDRSYEEIGADGALDYNDALNYNEIDVVGAQTQSDFGVGGAQTQDNFGAGGHDYSMSNVAEPQGNNEIDLGADGHDYSMANVADPPNVEEEMDLSRYDPGLLPSQLNHFTDMFVEIIEPKPSSLKQIICRRNVSQRYHSSLHQQCSYFHFVAL